MILSHLTVPFLASFGFMCIISPAFGGDPLTDNELNEIGAGGVQISPQLGEDDPQFLSDNLLANYSGRGVPGYLWPFQYAPLKLPSDKRIAWSGGGLDGGLNIDLGPALQFRDITPPPSQNAAGSVNAIPLAR